MNVSPRKILRFQQFIFSWWKKHKRDLPWRRTHDPYKIAVSEIMLQQTQVSRVLPKFADFIGKYPDVSTLAHASLGDVLREWKGMGYNRRAKYLHLMAKQIVEKYKGVFPNDEKSLIQLPGLGVYTARAIMIFAFRRDVAAVDTNIRRIITHFFFSDIPQSPKTIQRIADQLIPKGKSWEWHQALMDYGALALEMKSRVATVHKKKVIPFKESDRFYRGRILDWLRKQSVKEDELINGLNMEYKKNVPELQRIIQGLLDEGLIIRVRDRLRLPD